MTRKIAPGLSCDCATDASTCGPHMLLPQLPGIAYGGDYNPDQWDEATFREDLDLMVEVGVNLVSVGIFSWTRLEPADGQYDLEWLAQKIDALYERGIYVDLATATASPPAWMATEHPEILPVTAQGVRLGVGSRQHTCLTSPYLRAKQAALAGVLAKRFGDHPGVVLWHVNNEYGCHVHECFCSACAQAFREWLTDRYAALDALNGAWGTAFWSQTYTQWGQIMPPGAMPTFHNPGQMMDWRRFCDHQMRGMFLGEYAAIREYSDRPITTNFMGAFPWMDHHAWAQVVDVVSSDAYPDPASPAAAWEWAWHGDLERALAGGAWMLMEQSPSAVQWRARNSMKRPGQFALWSLSSIARGADGVLQFQWRQSIRGSETFHAGMIPHAGRESRTFRDVRDLGGVLPCLASLRGTRTEASVAIVVDWESEWARCAALGPVERGEHFAEARAWHRTWWERGFATDIVGLDSDLSSYAVIVVPGVFVDHPSFAARLHEAAIRGAQVVVTAPTAVVDVTGCAHTGGYLGSLRDLVGVHVVDHHCLSGPVAPVEERSVLVDRISRAVGTPGAETWVGLTATSTPLLRIVDRLGTPAPDLRGGMWAEEIALNLGEPAYRGSLSDEEYMTAAYPDLWASIDCDVEPVAFFDGRGGGVDLAGRAAITRKPCRPPQAHTDLAQAAAEQNAGVGQGAGIGQGAGVGQGAGWYVATNLDAVSRAALVELCAVYARIRPVVAGLPDGVEAVRRGPALFLLNHSDRAVELSGVVGTDLVSGRPCTGHVMLAPRSGMVVTGQDA